MFILFCLYAALRALYFDFVAKPLLVGFFFLQKRFELIEAPLSKKTLQKLSKSGDLPVERRRLSSVSTAGFTR